ncbi:MAG: hypothetical protein ABSH01_24485 [Terriglobia bacterium]
MVVRGAFGDQGRALITVIPHTTSLRGSAFSSTVPDTVSSSPFSP